MSSASPRSILAKGLQLTRLASTREAVSPDSPHWAIEPYIPVATADLIDVLLARPGGVESHVGEAGGGESGGDRDGGEAVATSGESSGEELLRSLYEAFADLLHHRYRPLASRFARRYAGLDPDRDTREPVVLHEPADETAQLEAVHQIALAGRRVLEDAGYTQLDRAELEQAVGRSSLWGVPLHVDFDVFDAIIVYARGDIVGQRAARRWRRLYREEIHDVPLYQRVVVMFKLRHGFSAEDDLDHTMLHLRMFKNIPKPDIDMLLPGTRVRFSWMDHLRNWVPSIGGIGVTLFKIARIGLFVAAITLSMAAVLAGLVLALIGYAIRSVMSHLHAKNRYMLNLTRSLYYQKLDSNAGVAYRLLEEAESQRHREAVLAYHALLTTEGPISLRRLRRRGERMVREMVNVEIEFRAADAVELLESWDLIDRDADGKLRVCAAEEALRRLHACWDRSLSGRNDLLGRGFGAGDGRGDADAAE